MPTYDYECDVCHHRFEMRQSFDSDPVGTCPACQGNARRKLSSVPIIFKGSGWYVNDHGRRNSSISSDSASPGEESKSGAEKDTKKEAESPASSKDQDK